MTEITFGELNFLDDAEIQKVALIHEETPMVWDPSHKVQPEALAQRVAFLKGAKDDPSFYCVVARGPEHIVGIHWLRLVESPYGKYAKIDSLWVAESCRKQGVGSTLKRMGEQWASSHGAKYMTTTVSPENHRMLEFNKKLGFRPRMIEMVKPLA
ncbi:MAG: N-acetyltransferase family protein [Oligoflexales bacterium]